MAFLLIEAHMKGVCYRLEESVIPAQEPSRSVYISRQVIISPDQVPRFYLYIIWEDRLDDALGARPKSGNGAQSDTIGSKRRPDLGGGGV
jgi:hypothetical protein